MRQSETGERLPYNDFNSSTEDPERLLRVLTSFSGATLRDLAAKRGPCNGGLAAPAGAKPKSRGFAPATAPASLPTRRQDQDEHLSEEPMKSCATPRKLPGIGLRARAEIIPEFQRG